MTRPYAAKKLLEHGALTFGELRRITGWLVGAVSSTMAYLMRIDEVIVLNIHGRRHYALAV